MKKTAMDRFSDFMAGRGFYIVLLLCVAALGVSGYYLFTGMSDIGKAVSAPAKVVVTPAPKATLAPLTTPVAAEPDHTPIPSREPTKARPVETAAPASLVAPVPTAPPVPTAEVPPTATASVFTWPVKGEILRGYAVESLAYDKTMGDWRAHDGIDIAAGAGTQVMAPAGGTVSDLYTDDLMGTCVVILHADGVMSTCANLEKIPVVEIGDTVRTGDIIGSVGTGAIAESGEESHLHLSMTKDGISVDPLEYLPERH